MNFSQPSLTVMRLARFLVISSFAFVLTSARLPSQGSDCNNNGIDDSMELAGNDCNSSGVPDDCELPDNDCNNNGVPDDCDFPPDCNSNSIPDDCEVDCNNNGIPDDCELFPDCNSDGIPDGCDLAGNDCNANGFPDDCEIAFGSGDINGDGIPDECNPGTTFCEGDGDAGSGCTPCPCGNDAAPGSAGGCINASGTGAVLVAVGVASFANDTLSFDLVSANPSTFAVLVSADNALPNTGLCSPGSGVQSLVLDGLRCVGGSLQRHGTRPTNSSGDAGTTGNGWGPPNGPIGGLIASGGFVVGQTRQFQVFYRESPGAACLTGQNTSQGVAILVEP